jgi:hypothetical protein
VVFISRPPKRSMSARTASLCSASSSRHRASPSRLSVSVDPDRSVKTTVVKMQSEISLGDLAKSRRPAQSTETHSSSPMTRRRGRAGSRRHRRPSPPARRRRSSQRADAPTPHSRGGALGSSRYQQSA